MFHNSSSQGIFHVNDARMPLDSGNDIVVMGLFLYQAIVVRVNLRLMIATNQHSCVSLFWQIGSLVFFYLVLWLLSSIRRLDTFGAMGLLVNLVPGWTLLVLVTLGFAAAERIGWYFEAHMGHYQHWVRI